MVVTIEYSHSANISSLSLSCAFYRTLPSLSHARREQKVPQVLLCLYMNVQYRMQLLSVHQRDHIKERKKLTNCCKQMCFL